MQKIQCSCGNSYWPNQAWIHMECATNEPATNGVLGLATNEIAVAIPDAVVPVAVGSDGLGRTRNRRDREAYNAYQREYMRKRRAG